MSNLMTCHTLGSQLGALLGLPKNVLSFELRCEVDEIVTVKCEYHPEAAEGIDVVLAEYELVPRAETQPQDDGVAVHMIGEAAPRIIRARLVPHLAEVIGFDAWMRCRAEVAHAAMMAQARAACGAQLTLRSVAPGDKVTLRSGGPDMTVIGITYDGSQVACKWMADGLMQGDSFAPECLARCATP